MITTNAALCLAIYAVILVLSYLVVRRGWLRAYPVFLAGFVSNAIVLFFFSLERGTSVLHALVVALIWSGFFTGASVTAAVVFRSGAVRFVSAPTVEPVPAVAHAGVQPT